MKFKKVLSILLAVIMMACTMSIGFSASADEGSIEQNTEQTTQPEEPVLPVTFSEGVTIMKGKSTYISANNAGTNVTFKSSRPSVATVASNGKITAKKCGKTLVTASTSKYQLNLTVEVIKATKKEIKGYGTAITKATTAKTNSVLIVNKPVKVKSTTKIKIANINGATPSFTSSNTKIATVNSSGVITAKATGTASITAKVKVDGVTHTFIDKITVVKGYVKSITTAERDAFYGKSAFIGSSIGVGQRMYFDSKGKKYLGGPLMLVKGCYSFNNDKNKSTKYKVTYKGTPMKAKDAIYKSKVKRVFVAMGTNDMFYSGEKVFTNDYKPYLEGIRKKNPNVVIFVESTSPVRAGREGKYLNSNNIAKMNKKLEEYCKTQKDMYFVDVCKRMRTSDGKLRKDCCSDGYVHLSMTGYKYWTEDLIKYTNALMLDEQYAKDAVATAQESKCKAQVTSATALVNKLQSSTVKTNLQKQLKAIKTTY